MIGTLWEEIRTAMKGAGWTMDPDEDDDVKDGRYVVRLPRAPRDDQASTTAKARVEWEIRVRMQFRAKRDGYLHLEIAQAVEKVVVAMRGTQCLLYEEYTLEERPGGYIADVRFSARDSMN